MKRSLPEYDQVYVIAREIARLAHMRRLRSVLFDHPRKWVLLDLASVETKHKICEADIDDRARLLMLFYTTDEQFRAYFRRHWLAPLASIFTDIPIHFYFLKLRIKPFLFLLIRPFVIQGRSD